MIEASGQGRKSGRSASGCYLVNNIYESWRKRTMQTRAIAFSPPFWSRKLFQLLKSNYFLNKIGSKSLQTKTIFSLILQILAENAIPTEEDLRLLQFLSSISLLKVLYFYLFRIICHPKTPQLQLPSLNFSSTYQESLPLIPRDSLFISCYVFQLCAWSEDKWKSVYKFAHFHYLHLFRLKSAGGVNVFVRIKQADD